MPTTLDQEQKLTSKSPETSRGSSGKKKKILYVANDFDFFVAHRLPFAMGAHEKGYEVHFATPRSPWGLPSEVISRLTYHPINMKRAGRGLFSELRVFLELLRLYRKLKPDIVHHFTIKPVVYGSFLGKFLKVPLVVNTVTGLGSIYIQKNFVNYLTQALIGLSYKQSFNNKNLRVIFQNPDDRKLFLKRKYINESNSCVILGSGVDVNQYTPQPLPSGPVTILYPGRMIWDKGVGDLVEAGKILHDKGLKFFLRFCGPIDTMNPTGIQLEKIDEWEDLPFFYWDGPQLDMQRVFAESHIVCLPSYREGVPIALLEAAACGRPIVTAKSPGCQEVVHVGKNGFLVPTHSPKELAEALEKLILSAELRKSMGKQGREIAEKQFSRTALIGEVLKIYGNY